MRAVVFRAPGDAGLADIPEPEPAPGEVKIRVRSCSLCGTDLKVRAHGRADIKPPRVGAALIEQGEAIKVTLEP